MKQVDILPYAYHDQEMKGVIPIMGIRSEIYVHLGSAAAIQWPMFSMTYETAQAICSCILALARAITLIIRTSVPSNDTGMK